MEDVENKGTQGGGGDSEPCREKLVCHHWKGVDAEEAGSLNPESRVYSFTIDSFIYCPVIRPCRACM